MLITILESECYEVSLNLFYFSFLISYTYNVVHTDLLPTPFNPAACLHRGCCPTCFNIIQTKVSEKRCRNTKKQHVYCQTAKDPPTVLQCISYESKQATRSHPGAFPCTHLSLILLLLVSPGLPRATWQALNALNQTGKCLSTVDVVWTGCSSTWHVLKIFNRRQQLAPVPNLRNVILAISSCCAQALQGSKTPRTKRRRQLGLCNFYQRNTGMKIGTRVYL